MVKVTTASEVGWSEPPSGSTVIAIWSAARDADGSATAVGEDAGVNVPAGAGASEPSIVQASYTWSSGRLGRSSPTKKALPSPRDITIAPVCRELLDMPGT